MLITKVNTGYSNKFNLQNSYVKPKNHSISFKANLDSVNFSHLSSSDKKEVEDAINDGTVKQIGSGQENRIFSSSSLNVVIKQSITTNNNTINKMMQNLKKEKNLIELFGPYLADTGTRIAKQLDSFVDSKGHLIVIYEKATGYHFKEEDMNDYENKRRLMAVSADLRRAHMRFTDDHKKNVLFDY